MEFPLGSVLADSGDSYGDDMWPEEDVTSPPEVLYFSSTRGPTLSAVVDVNGSSNGTKPKYEFYQVSEFPRKNLLILLIIVGQTLKTPNVFKVYNLLPIYALHNLSCLIYICDTVDISLSHSSMILCVPIILVL